MQTIYADINNTRDVFTFNLITSADIGEKKYNQIVDALDKASVVVEDILFELDNKWSDVVKKRLIRNRIKCLKCGDIIESTYRHDWVQCSCGACFVDGGHDYMRVGGNREDWEDLSEWEITEWRYFMFYIGYHSLWCWYVFQQ